MTQKVIENDSYNSFCIVTALYEGDSCITEEMKMDIIYHEVLIFKALSSKEELNHKVDVMKFSTFK